MKIVIKVPEAKWAVLLLYSNSIEVPGSIIRKKNFCITRQQIVIKRFLYNGYIRDHLLLFTQHLTLFSGFSQLYLFFSSLRSLSYFKKLLSLYLQNSSVLMLKYHSKRSFFNDKNNSLKIGIFCFSVYIRSLIECSAPLFFF